jgi:histidinol-phosphate phosphatase family protein
VSKLKQAVILCGGLGTRLRPYTNHTPKPMVLCNGKPFLWYLLQQLYEQKINRFVLLTGYLAEKIESYFGDGSSWGWEIHYSKGPVEWDTGKRIWEARAEIDDQFLLLYSDNFTPFPLDKVIALHKKNQSSLTFMIAPKKPGNINLNKEDIVQKYNNNRSDESLDYVEIGYMIVEKDQTLAFYETPECSFSSILKKMAAQHQISAWIQRDAYHSISDPGRWEKTEEYLKSKKIILIDRDGVINKKAPKGEYIRTWEEFEWIEDTVQAMKKLAQQGHSFIVITNQAGIARNMVSEKELTRMHQLMISELKVKGIKILDIYVCPHHWDDDCECRKPKAGLFYRIAKEYFLRMDKTLYIGDDVRDCEAAYNAECGSVLIVSDNQYNSIVNRPKWSINVNRLSDALPEIESFMVHTQA